jgi:hypothetical protein
MNTFARIGAGIAVPAAALALAACGGSHHVAATQTAATDASVVAVASGSSTSAAHTDTTRATTATHHAAPSHSVAPSSKLNRTSASQAPGLYSEGDHPKVPGTPAPTVRTHTTTSQRSSDAGARPATLKAAPKQPNLGKYVGPPNNGAGSCGYVAVGPGMEQAEAFSVRSVGCDTARRVATASQGHTTTGHVSYRALGFSCTGSTPSNQSTLRYVCSAGGQSISFVVS